MDHPGQRRVLPCNVHQSGEAPHLKRPRRHGLGAAGVQFYRTSQRSSGRPFGTLESSHPQLVFSLTGAKSV